MKPTPQQFQICQTCEELFDDGKYYVSTLDYNKLRSSHDELLEALKEAMQWNWLDDDIPQDIIAKCEKAIQKAEGK